MNLEVPVSLQAGRDRPVQGEAFASDLSGRHTELFSFEPPGSSLDHAPTDRMQMGSVSQRDTYEWKVVWS